MFLKEASFYHYSIIINLRQNDNTTTSFQPYDNVDYTFYSKLLDNNATHADQPNVF